MLVYYWRPDDQFWKKSNYIGFFRKKKNFYLFAQWWCQKSIARKFEVVQTNPHHSQKTKTCLAIKHWKRCPSLVLWASRRHKRTQHVNGRQENDVEPVTQCLVESWRCRNGTCPVQGELLPPCSCAGSDTKANLFLIQRISILFCDDWWRRKPSGAWQKMLASVPSKVT